METFKKHLDNLSYFEAEDKTILTEVFHPKNDTGIEIPFSLAYASIKPGNSSLPHTLKQKEMYLFTKGKGEISIAGETHLIFKGSCILVPGGALQSVENNGTEDLEFYCIVSPPWTAADEIIS